MKTGALIVAAGHDKDREAFRPMLPVGDSTVIRRIIITMKQAGIDPIVVVTGSRGTSWKSTSPSCVSSACGMSAMRTPRCFTASAWG